MDVLYYSRLEKVKQSFYSNLCNGKGVRKLKQKMLFHFKIDFVNAIDNKDKELYDSFFKDIHMWITTKYAELENETERQ